jgi:NAD(P)-dependent dehydrogenase (short-subunit alcohol dehydrogenase family)
MAWNARTTAGQLGAVRTALRPDAWLTYLPADYSDLGNVPRLAEQIRGTTGRIDVLVNNAARPGGRRCHSSWQRA